jgi:thiamine biosynthesis lipoprotein
MLYARFLALIVLLVLASCVSKPEVTFKNYEGEIFGTYYRVQVGDSDRDFQTQFDSIFAIINTASNSYIQESEVSDFNANGILVYPSFTFRDMLDSCKKYHEQSQGYFEPTLYPLIKAWGFSFEEREQMDSSKVALLKSLMGFESQLQVTDTSYAAAQSGVMLDITGLGEGYAIDKLAEVLDQAGVANYLVEIGGEMKGKGQNPTGESWTIGIEDPAQAELGVTNTMLTKVTLNRLALSSSGNYRKFYIDEQGNRRSHLIDPKTGFPVSHSMVSVSVLATSATQADALATAFMAMGPEKAKVLAESLPGVEAMFVLAEKDRLRMEFTSGFPEELKQAAK